MESQIIEQNIGWGPRTVHAGCLKVRRTFLAGIAMEGQWDKGLGSKVTRAKPAPQSCFRWVGWIRIDWIGVLGFRFRFQLDLSVGEFDRVFHAVAAVLLANLFGLFLNERRERIDAA